MHSIIAIVWAIHESCLVIGTKNEVSRDDEWRKQAIENINWLADIFECSIVMASPPLRLFGTVKNPS